MTDTTRTLLLMMIVFSNGIFFFMWGIKFFEILRSEIWESFPWIYVIFFMCCRRDRMVMEEQTLAWNEKWEKIISKIEDIQFFMKDMLSKYVNNTSFEGHENFLRLLYLIEN